MSGSGREALPNVWEALPDVLCVVERPSRISVSGRGPAQMSGSSQETLPDICEFSGDPPGFVGVVERPSRMSGSGREALPNVWEALRIYSSRREVLPVCPGGGQEDLPDVRVWSGGPSKCPGGPAKVPRVVERPSRISGSGRGALPDVREFSGDPPEYP